MSIFPLRSASQKLSQRLSWRGGTRRTAHVADFVRRRRGLLSFALAGAAFASALLSWLILAGATPIAPTRTLIWALLALNLSFVLPLLGLVVWRASRLWLERHQGLLGAQLHSRMVGLFAGVALVPAALMGGVALVTLDQGLDSWFGERTQRLLTNTSAIANIYLQEEGDALRRDAEAMALDLNYAWQAQNAAPNEGASEELQNFLEAQTALRVLGMAAIIDADGTPLLATSTWQDAPQVPPAEAFRTAEAGQSVLFTIRERAELRVLLWLDAADAWLYGARRINPQMLQLMDGMVGIGEQYALLRGQRMEVQMTFALVYLGVALVILAAASWLGLLMANRLAQPIMQLMHAADKVAQGQLTTRMPEPRDGTEMQRLAQSFNRMVAELQTQRADLALRHHFTEMVLAGVSSGVLGLNREGKIVHANRRALQLLERTRRQAIGRPPQHFLPALDAVLRKADSGKAAAAEQVAFTDGKGNPRQWLVRVVQTRASQHAMQRVLNLDDVTELVAAQRIAAWADIARRIAHEIKNPLTPIQLAAERLESRYAGQVEQPGIFRQCVRTIVAQVEDIGRMVDEFASFARMPKAVMRRFNCQEMAEQALFLQRIAHADIEYELVSCDAPILEGDSRQFSQALSNLFKNAAEAIDAAARTSRTRRARRDKIALRMARRGQSLEVSVSDTGGGFAGKNREQLIEPYTGTRPQGSGLGLAIVRKVMEEHGGQMQLDEIRWPDKRRGAKVTLRFPLRQAAVRAA